MKKPLNTQKEIERQRIYAQISDLKRRITEKTKELLKTTDNASDLELTRGRDALFIKLYNLEVRLRELGAPPKRKIKRTDGTIRNRVKTQD